MRPVQSIFAKVRHRGLSKCKGVRAERRTMDALAAHHFRYVASEARHEEDLKDLTYMLRMVGPERAAEMIEADPTGVLRELRDNPKQTDDVNARLSVWKAAREYLRVAGDSKIADIRAFLEWLGYENVSRQVIESAVERHRSEFGIRTVGRDRVVSLKEKERESSSSD